MIILFMILKLRSIRGAFTMYCKCYLCLVIDSKGGSTFLVLFYEIGWLHGLIGLIVLVLAFQLVVPVKKISFVDRVSKLEFVCFYVCI
jgi:hypothetical protein